MPRLFPADKREGEEFIYDILQDICLWVLTFCSDVSLIICASRALATAVLVPVVRACDHRNDLSDLFPPAFVNLQMVQAVSLAILEPVVPVQSLRMPALYFQANFFSLKIEDKGKSRTSRSRGHSLWSSDKIPLYLRGIYSIKYLLKRYLFLINHRSLLALTLSVWNNPGNKVDSLKYGAKWNKYLLTLSRAGFFGAPVGRGGGGGHKVPP